MNLRPYQERARDFLASRQRLGLVHCPAGGGKTFIGASALAKAAPIGARIGWACNTREQADQGQQALNLAGVKACWVKCVAGLTPQDVAEIEYLVIDEAHHVATAVTWQAIFSACKGRVYALTATPPDDPDTKMFWDRLWGDNVIKIERDEIKATGHLAEGHVKFINIESQNEYRNDVDRLVTGKLFEYFADWGRLKHLVKPYHDAGDIFSPKATELLQFVEKTYRRQYELVRDRSKWWATKKLVIPNERRNSHAVAAANYEISQGKTGLLLVESIEQGRKMVEQIEGSMLAYSGMGIKARREAMAKARSGDVRCLIATSLADEGLDIPRLSFAVLTSCGKSSRLSEQRSGRVLRPFEGKEIGVIYDFLDLGTPMGRRNAESRRKTYKKLGYSIEVITKIK